MLTNTNYHTARRALFLTLVALLLLAFALSLSTVDAGAPPRHSIELVTNLRRYGNAYGGEFDFAADGDYVYNAEYNRLRIVSFADPARPVVVGEQFDDLEFTRLTVAPEQRRLFANLSDGDNTFNSRLRLYDISDPAAPRLLDELPYYGGDELQVYDDHLFVARDDGSLLVYRFADDKLGLVGRYNDDTPTLVNRIMRDGNTLIVTYYLGTAAHYAIRLFDISDVTQPRLVGTVPSRGGMAIPANGHLYVSNDMNQGTTYPDYLDIWDIRDPAAPRVVSRIDDILLHPIGQQGNSLLFLDRLSPSDNDTFRLYDVSNPTAFTLIGSSEIPGRVSVTNALWIAPNTLYMGEIQRADIVSPFDIYLRGQYNPYAERSFVAIQDRYLYAINERGGVNIYDATDPAEPRFRATRLTGSFNLPGYPAPIYHVVGNQLVVVAEHISLLDVTDPLAPTFIGQVSSGPIDSSAPSAVANGHLYKFLRDGSLYIVHLDDLALTVLPFDFYCYDAAGGSAQLAVLCRTPESGLVIELFDVTNPAVPVHTVSVPVPDAKFEYGDLELVYPHLFYLHRAGALTLYDISAPTAPEIVNVVPARPGASSCSELLPLAQPSQYLRLCLPVDAVDLSDPAAPRTSLETDWLITGDSAPPRIGAYFYGASLSSWYVSRIQQPICYGEEQCHRDIYIPFVSRGN